MTDQELKDIVAAVVAELEKSGVDFDYKANQAKDDDLVFVIRGTAPDYQGVTVTWKGLLDIITSQATQAKNDAVTAKNSANTILEQVKSNGTAISNFVATSKTDLENQKNESVKEVRNVYQTDLNELKGDLGDETGIRQQIIETFLTTTEPKVSSINLKWEHGAISSDGNELFLSTRIRTPFIDVSLNNTIYVNLSNSYSVYILFYDEFKHLLRTEGWYSIPKIECHISSAKYIRLVLRKPDASNDIIPSEGSNCNISLNWRLLPMTYYSMQDSQEIEATDNIMTSFFQSRNLVFINCNIKPIYSDLPTEYQAVKNLFVFTMPIKLDGEEGRGYEQFIFNNAVNKLFYRVFLIDNETPQILRNWTELLKSNSVYPYLHNKTGIILGDSISYGLYSYWDGNQRKNSDGLSPDYAPKRISDYFSALCGMTMTNIARRGTGYVADSKGLGNALVKARETDFSNYDFVGLCFGINDYIQNKTLGSLQTDAEGTVVGNLTKVLKKIYADNPLAKVVIFSPYNAWGQVAVNQGANELYGDESTNYALGHANGAGYTLQQLVDAIDEVADHYGVTHERLNKSNVVNRINIKDIMVDGLHPTLESLPMLAAEMFAQKDFG